jgi:two-component system, OmpR family, response regulator MtrA
MTDPRVLIADDDQDILRLVERRLSRRGYEVVTATNGQEALDSVAETPPDAIVLDWLMPKVTGSDACKLIKADPLTTAIPVVLLTARATEGDIEEGLASGADAYLTKPFDIYELDAIIRQVIQIAAAQQGAAGSLEG